MKSFLINLGLIFSISLNALPLDAQKKTPVKPSPVEFQIARGFVPSQIFREFVKSGDDRVFSNRLKKLAGETEAAEAENRLAAETMNFFELMHADSEKYLALASLKAGEISEKRYEKLKSNPPAPASPPVTRRPPRGGPSAEAVDDRLFISAPETVEAKTASSIEIEFSAQNSSDEPTVSTTETDTGMEISGSAGKKLEITDGIVTRTENADTKVNFDGKANSWAHSRSEKTEVLSKSGIQKLTKNTKMQWGAEFNVCPDAKGIVTGRINARIYTQTVVHTGTDIAAPASDLELDLAVTGYVNDDAVFTHFDIKGAVTGTMTGYDRARQRKLAEVGDEFYDGSRRIVFSITGSKPPQEAESEYGSKKTIPAEFGKVIATSPDALTAGQIDLITQFARWGLQAGFGQLEPLMKISVSKWRNGTCVDVELTAPKNALQPGEEVDVKAVSVSKQDLSKFDARLEGRGSASVTPTDQMGAPEAIYALTATGDGTAGITVRSVSRRGIGFGLLEFGRDTLDDEPLCDGSWHGTIEIRRSREDVFKKTTKPGDVSTNLHLSGWQETVNRSRYEGKVKILDPKINTATVSLSDASFTASAERLFLNHGFFTEPNDCGWYVKKIIKTESGQENKESGTGEGKTDVTIQISGTNYRVNLMIPEFAGTFQNRGWHRPSGYCQEANNKARNTNDSGATRFDRVAASFDGAIDPRQPDVLVGTKSIKSDDGKEETVIKWRIKRCAPVKANKKQTKK